MSNEDQDIDDHIATPETSQNKLPEDPQLKNADNQKSKMQPGAKFMQGSKFLLSTIKGIGMGIKDVITKPVLAEEVVQPCEPRNKTYSDIQC